MKITAIYVYAIIPTGDQVVFEVAGLDDHHEEVYSIPHGQIAAVVGVSPLADYRGLQRNEAVRYLVAHQRVLETVMRDYPALPVKFGTVLPDEDRVHHLLAQAETLFRAALETLADQVQMEVVVLWNLQEVFQQIGQEEPIALLKAQIASHPPEETMADRVAPMMAMPARVPKAVCTQVVTHVARPTVGLASRARRPSQTTGNSPTAPPMATRESTNPPSR